MRHFVGLPILIAAAALLPRSPVAQSASFKCAPSGTTVDYSDGSRVVWLEQVANGCRMQTTRGDAWITNVWFAPSAAPPERISRAWAAQVKPATLWPLSVGKTVRSVYEGEGTTPGYRSKWNLTFKVENYETLSTKAGSFDTFVVSFESEQYPPSNWRSISRVWYAPQPGVTVRWDYRDNQEQGSSESSGEAIAVHSQ